MIKVEPINTAAAGLPEAELELRIGGSLIGFSLASVRLKGDRWVSLAGQAVEIYAEHLAARDRRLGDVCNGLVPAVLHVIGKLFPERS